MKIEKKQDVITSINDYLSNGTADHFKIGADTIKGFVFKRSELHGLLGSENNKHLFLMWGLKADQQNPPAKHLNLIIAGVLKNHVNNTYSIDDSIFLEADSVVKINVALYGSLKSIGNTANEIEQKKFASAHFDFLRNGNSQHLYITDGEKIKGYHLGDNLYLQGPSTYLEDLRSLGLICPVTSANALDSFIFKPIIRKYNPDNTTVTNPYLSVAISNYTLETMHGPIVEYCLPCPSACPTNYPIQ
jgi:hypothetical protein